MKTWLICARRWRWTGALPKPAAAKCRSTRAGWSRCARARRRNQTAYPAIMRPASTGWQHPCCSWRCWCRWRSADSGACRVRSRSRPPFKNSIRSHWSPQRREKGCETHSATSQQHANFLFRVWGEGCCLLQPVLIYYFTVWRWFLVEKNPVPVNYATAPAQLFIVRCALTHTATKRARQSAEWNINVGAGWNFTVYSIFINF